MHSFVAFKEIYYYNIIFFCMKKCTEFCATSKSTALFPYSRAILCFPALTLLGDLCAQSRISLVAGPAPANLPLINVPKGYLVSLTNTLQILWMAFGVKKTPRHLLLSSAQIRISQSFWAALIFFSSVAMLRAPGTPLRSQHWMKNRASASHEVWGSELFLASFSQRAGHVGLLSAELLLVCGRSSIDSFLPPPLLSLLFSPSPLARNSPEEKARARGSREISLNKNTISYSPGFLEYTSICIYLTFILIAI